MEVFPFYSSGLAVLPPPTTSGSSASTPRRSLVVVEIAAPLVVRDAAVIWPIRRNLAINCGGALGLLATVVIAGLGFRSYARGRRLELQLEIAREVQSELLPSHLEAGEPVRLATLSGVREAREAGHAASSRRSTPTAAGYPWATRPPSTAWTRGSSRRRKVRLPPCRRLSPSLAKAMLTDYVSTLAPSRTARAEPRGPSALLRSDRPWAGERGRWRPADRAAR